MSKDLREKYTDWASLVVPSSASRSADGRYCVYGETATDWEANDYKDHVCLMEVLGSRVFRRWEGWGPKWSPDGSMVGYLAGYNGEMYLCVYVVATDEHRYLTPVYESSYFMGHLAVKNFEWSPNGERIAYCSTSGPVVSASDGGVVVVDRMLYKTKGGRVRAAIADGALTHIYVIAVAGGEAVQLTDGLFNEHSIDWSPDGRRIAFVSNRSVCADDNQLHDLWIVELEAGVVTRLTDGFGTVFTPKWSPDGLSIAFLGTVGRLSTNDSPAEDTHVYVIGVSGAVSGSAAEAVCVTRKRNRRVEQFYWFRDGSGFYFTAGDCGTVAIWSVDLADHSIQKIFGEEMVVLEFTPDPDGRGITYISSHTTHPPAVCHCQLKPGVVTQLTHVASLPGFRGAESFWFHSFDGLDIQGWLMRPVGFADGVRYPLVLVIHGGPHNMFGYAYEERMQVLAAAGYGVLFINPRGSSGYGQAFSSGNYRDWGGGDYEDLMAGVDQVLRAHRWIDGDRLGVTGQSYGGYMTNRIVTKTARFKGAVADGGLSNLISFAGTSLYHSLMESEFGGRAHHDWDVLWRCSPVKDIGGVRTPTLLLHGAADNEVPVSQAEEMYIGLTKVGVSSALVMYTGEGHGWRPDLRPLARYDVLDRIIGWMDRYVKNALNDGDDAV